MKTQCKWCEEENSEGVPVEPYMVECDDKHEFVYGCFECIQENTDPQNRVPVLLPDRLRIISSSALDNYLEQKQALIAVSEEIRKAKGEPTSDSYYPFPAGRLKDIFKRLNDTIFNHEKFKLKLGLLEAVPIDMLSGAYCPACRSPLIKTNQQVTSLAISDIVAGQKRNFGARRKQAFVCLGCLTTYIEDRDYE